LKPISDVDGKHLFACPACGGHTFLRVHTGYIRIVPCELLSDGKVAICDFDEEQLEEADDGAQWSRAFRCEMCSFELTEEHLNLGKDEHGHDMVISDIECICAEVVTGATIAKHGQSTSEARPETTA